MRILLAEDDPISRKVLTMFLTKSGHEVVQFQDGASALSGLLAPAAPQVAILDWMMPGLSGIEVCAKLRAANSKARPYIIMHSARAAKEDIATGLDAGADDYLPKPFNPAELLARLRVAERAIHYQHELKQRIDELELLMQRYNLLGEIVGQQNSHSAVSTKSGAVVENSKAQQDVGLLIGLTGSEIEAVVARTFSELRLGDTKAARVQRSDSYCAAPVTAWAGMILVNEQIWVDLLLEASTTTIALICEKTLRRQPHSDRELRGVLAEAHTILSAAIKAAVQAKGLTVLTPLLSRTRIFESTDVKLAVSENRHSHVFSFGNHSLGLTVVYNPCHPIHKTAGQLHSMDILAEPIFPAEMHDLPLLNRGAVLNQRYIDRLSSIEPTNDANMTVSIFELSKLAKYFCQ